MLDRHAIARFVARQRRLLSDTYDRAWQDGQDNFADDNPDDDPLAGDAGGGLLLAPRRKTLVVDQQRKASALRLANRSLDKVQHELAAITPSAADLAAADEEVAAGALAPAARTAWATAQALASWLPANMSRFDAGESVAWAGEQHGYMQAAGDNNELLEWITESDTHVCEDCSALGDMPPMPALDWPTAPGEGATTCSVGCRCALEVSGETATRELNSTEQGALDAIAAKASENFDRGFPDDFGEPPPGIVRPPTPPNRPPGGMEPGAPVRPADGAHARPGEQDVGASRAEVEQQRAQLWSLLDQGYTVPRAAREMGISPRWAYRMRQQGRPGVEPPPPTPVVKPDHEVIVERAQVMAQVPETLWRTDDPWHGFREYDASEYGTGHYYSESKGDARYYLTDPDGIGRYEAKPDSTLHEYRVPEGVNLLTIPEDRLPFTGSQLRQAVVHAGYNGIRVIRTKVGPDTVVLYDKKLERVGPGPPKGKMDAKRDELFTWLDKGYSLKDAAANMGISATYASRLKKLGRRGAETREEPKPTMPKPKPGESKTMGEIRGMLDGMSDLDRADPAKLAKLGELINREAYDRERVLRSKATVERDRLRPLSNKAFRAYDDIKYDYDRQDEVAQLRAEYHRLEAELKAAWDTLNNVERESRLGVLSDVRDMGEKRGAKLKAPVRGFRREGTDVIKSDLEAVKRFFPTDWIRDSNANGGRTGGAALSVVRETGRAFYRGWDGSAHVSAGEVSTLQHELGHRMEYSRDMDRIRTAERNFYQYRTEGEQVRPLGAGYRADEVARRDRFKDAYMGKDYDPARRGQGRSYELLTMGSEALWWKARWGMDDEMTNWLLGLYAAA